MKSKNIKGITVWFTVLLTISFICGGKTVNGSTGDEVREVTMKMPGSETGSFKIEKMIEDTLFADPISGTIDDQGNIYIIDRKLAKLFKFSREGKLLHSIDNKGTGPGDLSTPVLVKFRDNKLYTFDLQLPYINIFDKDLKVIEQKKLANLRAPSGVEFIGDDMIVSSSPMQMLMAHRFFLYSADGEMKQKLLPDEQSDPAKILKGGKIIMKIPSFLYIEPTSGNLWCAALAPYEITVYNKNYEKIKNLKGDITFKFEEQVAGQGEGKVIIKSPVDRAYFFSMKNGKLYYCYKYDNETYLDVIENDCITKRFKSKEIKKVLCVIGQNTFLAGFNEGSEDGEPAVGIVSLEL